MFQARTKRIINLEGQVFGFWTVQALSKERSSYGQIQWIAECVCGKIKLLGGQTLRDGHSRSCGCQTKHLRLQTAIKTGIRIKHGPPSNYTRLFTQTRQQAKRRKLIFHLSFEQCRIIMQDACHYCGREPSNRASSVDPEVPFLYNGLDRKNNTLGYTYNNTVPCCWDCNRAKGTRSYEEYHDWIARSARHIFIENKKQRG